MKIKLAQSGRKHSDGDTIVEVLIAIAIAAFAIGISYATAQKSLQQAVASNEHNQALNFLENEVAALQLRFKDSLPAQFQTFAATGRHYCLDAAATGPSDSAHTWTALPNPGNPVEGTPLTSANYNPKCIQSADGSDYYLDITTSSSTASVNGTLYHLIARWERVGGGQTNQASLWYKVNNDPAQTLGLATSGGGGGTILPNCNNLSSPVLLTQAANNFLLEWGRGRNYVYKWTLPTPLPAGCNYSLTVTTGDPCHTDPNCDVQPESNEQLFIEFCSNSGGCDTADTTTTKSLSPIYRTGDTNDIPDAVASVSTTFSIPALSAQTDYLMFKHCSVDFWNNYPAEQNACRLKGNSIHTMTINY